MARRLAVLAVALTASLAFASAAQAGDYIVVLKDGVSEPTAAGDHTKKGAKVRRHYRHALNGYSAELSSHALAGVRSDPRVEFVTPNRRVRVPRDVHRARPVEQVIPKDCEQAVPFGVFRIGAAFSSALAGNCRGKVNANVAVLDTGIDPTHPDLNVAGGINCSGDRGGFEDIEGHGTAVAGVAGAVEDRNVTIVGVAPGVNLFAVRVFDRQGLGSFEAIICGLEWVTASRVDKHKKNDIDVANLSLRGFGSDDGNCGRSNHDALHLAVCRTTASGVPLVVAAGNDGIDLADVVPATYDEVITTTAMADYDGDQGGLAGTGNNCGEATPDDQFADFSNWATTRADIAHSIAAPGVCVFTTAPGGYTLISGTSFSAPHVAGAVALCISHKDCTRLTATQIKDTLVRDAAAYNSGHPGYGFVGDPFRPISGKYYGWLIRAGLY